MPMFVKAPGQRSGGPSDAGVNTLDIVPTIGDYLGADWKLAGQSLRRQPRDRKSIRVWSGWGPVVQMPTELYEALRDREADRLDKLERVPGGGSPDGAPQSVAKAPVKAASRPRP